LATISVIVHCIRLSERSRLQCFSEPNKGMPRLGRVTLSSTYLLPFVPSPSPSSLYLAHYSTSTCELEVKSSLSTYPMQDYELISNQRCQQSRLSESGRGRTGTDGKNGRRRHLPSPVVVAICKCVRLLPPSMRLYELEYPIPPAIPIRSKSRYYRRKCEHAPTAAYLKRPGQREEEDQCWWRRKPTQTRKHLFRHCKRWDGEQRKL
jgi:hypothetical protein